MGSVTVWHPTAGQRRPSGRWGCRAPATLTPISSYKNLLGTLLRQQERLRAIKYRFV